MPAPDGPHLAFPFRIGPDGRAARVTSLDEHVRDEIVQLVLTAPGERAFLPDFGGGARRLVFEGADETSAAMAKSMLSSSLSRYLGHRVTVEQLSVEAREATLAIDLQYRLAGSETSRRLRFVRNGG
jgi:phage baseplate assembly protein W